MLVLGMLIETILIILFIWIVIGFLIPILTFPRMPILRFGLPEKIPKELQEEISKLKKIKDKEKFVIAALEYLRKNFENKGYYLFIKLHRHYYKDASIVIEKRGFWPCHL